MRQIILAANLNQFERLMYVAEENDPIKDATPVKVGGGRHVVRDLETVPIFPYLECYLDYDDLNPDDYFVLPPSGQERTDMIAELQRIIGSNTTLYGVTVKERTKPIWISWFQNSRDWLTNGEINELQTRYNNDSLFLEIGPAWTPGENDPPKTKPSPGMTFDITTQQSEGLEFINKMPYDYKALWRNNGIGFVEYENQAVISNRVIKEVYPTFSASLKSIIQAKYSDDKKVLDWVDITGWTQVNV